MVVGAVYRGGETFEGVLCTRVRRDGANATDRLTEMIVGSKFHPQLHGVLLDGVSLGGLNVIDLDRLHEAVGLPIVAVMRRMPKMEAMVEAISRVGGAARKEALLRAAGVIHPIDVELRSGADGAGPGEGRTSSGRLFCQLRGIEPADAADLLNSTCTHAKVPEPLRAAHLIAAGLVLGQSGRRA